MKLLITAIMTTCLTLSLTMPMAGCKKKGGDQGGSGAEAAKLCLAIYEKEARVCKKSHTDFIKARAKACEEKDSTALKEIKACSAIKDCSTDFEKCADKLAK